MIEVITIGKDEYADGLQYTARTRGHQSVAYNARAAFAVRSVITTQRAHCRRRGRMCGLPAGTLRGEVGSCGGGAEGVPPNISG